MRNLSGQLKNLGEDRGYIKKEKKIEIVSRQTDFSAFKLNEKELKAKNLGFCKD